jgi:D-alanyl-D-alanine carboxypeptidase
MAPEPLTPKVRSRRGRVGLGLTALVAVGLVAVLGIGLFAQPIATANEQPSTGLASVAASVSMPAATVPEGAPSASPRSPAATPTPAPPSAPRAEDRPPAPTRNTELQATLDALRERYGMPGVSVAILFSDGSTWTGVSGMADVAGRRPMTEDTAFGLASMSKTFTAALVLDLARDGRIDIDRAVKAYLPDLAIDPTITVRQLLDHTSGLHDFFFAKGIDAALQAKPGAAWTAAASLKRVGKPYFKPGQGWHYSNTNYLVLGLLAERVTGRSQARLIRERFLEPLGLEETWYQAAEKPRRPLAHGYRLRGPVKDPAITDLSGASRVVPFTSVVTASGGAGSMAATAGDVARWARALYTGRVLGPGETLAMIQDAIVTAPLKPRVPYGLGVQTVTIDGRPTVGHSGSFLGMRGVVRHLPGNMVTIAVLTNQSRTDPGLIARALLSIATRAGPPCGSCAAAG